MRSIELFIIMICISVCACAQQERSVLHFDVANWHFGCINEADGKVSHVFRFTNIHTSPVVIEEVISTCGCAVPSYSKQPIKPNQSGFVTITFDPQGRMNYFSKSIRVVCNAGKSVNTLWLKGTIRTIDNVKEELPYSLTPELVADKLTLYYGILQHSTPSKQQEIRIYNRSSNVAKLSYRLMNKSGCLNINMPSTISGHSHAIIKISATPLRHFYGTFNDKLIILVNSVDSSPIQISGMIVDDMRGVNQASAPKFVCSQTYFKLGEITKKQRITTNVNIYNVGKSPLIIRKIECDQGISSDCDRMITIQPQHSINIGFTTSSIGGQLMEASVRLVTNDPKIPIHKLIFEAKIR